MTDGGCYVATTGRWIDARTGRLSDLSVSGWAIDFRQCRKWWENVRAGEAYLTRVKLIPIGWKFAVNTVEGTEPRRA